MQDIAQLTATEIRDYIAENISFVGTGKLITAASDLARAQRRRSDHDQRRGISGARRVADTSSPWAGDSR